ncbi:MAG TPA: MmcQ/YjbR family DNA-binding protein [Kofleriaceae bacterium]|nr:MmcQ/YjbR family DNA-binding protein [Kofleriaceae bacterium]
MGMKPRKKGAPAGGAGVQRALKAFALALPEATEDHPWGETVAKVKGKVFVFLGRGGPDFGIAVKLPESGQALLSMPFAEPTGYGLGKAGWVNVHWRASIPLELMQTWILESYRAVAPKKLAALV